MALNQNAHKRNLEALEYIKQQRAKQKKYNLTPGKAVEYAKTANNYANKLGSTLSELGEDTNNATIKNLGNKLYNNTGSNLGNKVYDFAKDKIAAFKSGADAASKASSMANTANNAGNVANTASNVSNVANNASNVANAANTASNASNMASAASNASSAASAASNASSAASGASSMASSGASGAPVVGTALGAISAGNNFAKGDNVNGALDAAKTGAAFIPVYGWIASAVISAIQMARNAFLKKKQEAHSKTQDAAAKATEESMLSANEKKQEIAQDRAEKQQELFADNPINGQLGDSGVAMPEKLPTFSDMASEVAPKNEDGEPQTISGQIQEALPKETITQGIMDKVKGLFGQNQDEGQMTGGAADASTVLDMFEDPTVLSDYNKLAREREQKRGTAPFKNFKYALKSGLRGDVTSDMNGLVLYDYKSPATIENENRKVADMINKEIEARRQPDQQPIKIGQDVQFTPEQQARYNEAMAMQEAGNQTQRVPILEGHDTGEALPPLPTAPATASPSKTNFDPNQFEIIGSDGTMYPAQQTQQVVQGQVSTTQPILPTQEQQQASPSVMYKTPEGIKQRIANSLARAQQGYNENSTNGFKLDNVTAQEYQAPVRDENGVVNNEAIKKDIWNRIGEFAGTGKRVLSNPLAQGAIAGLLYRATGGDSGDSLRFGVDWANEKAKSDFYQKQIDPNASSNVFGGRYTSSDWQAKEAVERAKAQQITANASLEERKRANELKAKELKLKIDKEKNQQAQAQNALNIKNQINDQIGKINKMKLSDERKQEIISQYISQYANVPGLEDLLKKEKTLKDYYGY